MAGKLSSEFGVVEVRSCNIQADNHGLIPSARGDFEFELGDRRQILRMQIAKRLVELLLGGVNLEITLVVTTGDKASFGVNQPVGP